jgi:hypothetical protein
MVNASVLRYLHLRGEYYADVPLLLPSLFVLNLSGTIAPAANLSMVNVSRFTGFVMLSDTHFTAVVGGTFDARHLSPPLAGSRGYQAVSIVGGANNAIRGVRAIVNNTGAALGVNQSPRAEISGCDVGGEGKMMMRGRCIWTLATSRAMVHDNHVHHCSAHALDFDAYTSASAAWNNLCEDNGEEGIFVEETASGNFIFNNTLRRNANGIGLYANAVGPVANNMIVGNVLEDNGGGITAGGYGHDPKKQSESNIFASNVLRGNTGSSQINPAHGEVVGDYWVSNSCEGDAACWRQPLPHSSASVAIFDP